MNKPKERRSGRFRQFWYTMYGETTVVCSEAVMKHDTTHKYWVRLCGVAVPSAEEPVAEGAGCEPGVDCW